jgi:hypothetical protein
LDLYSSGLRDGSEGHVQARSGYRSALSGDAIGLLDESDRDCAGAR